MRKDNINGSSKIGIKLDRVSEGLFIATAIVMVVLATRYFGIVHKWPASIALLLFILGEKKFGNIKNIFFGATTGLLLSASFSTAAKFLEQYIGIQAGSIVVLFVYVFIIVLLGGILHICFNTITFCYFTLALAFKGQMTVSWLITLFIGGGFLIASFIIYEKIYANFQEASSRKIVLPSKDEAVSELIEA